MLGIRKLDKVFYFQNNQFNRIKDSVIINRKNKGI